MFTQEYYDILIDICKEMHPHLELRGNYTIKLMNKSITSPDKMCHTELFDSGKYYMSMLDIIRKREDEGRRTSDRELSAVLQCKYLCSGRSRGSNHKSIKLVEVDPI